MRPAYGDETGNWKQSDDMPCAKEVLQAANRCSSRQYCRADLVAVCRIQSSGAGLVFGEFGRVVARRLVFPAIAWRQLHFQPARISSRMRVRQAVVFNLTSASSIHLFTSYHPHLDCDSRSLPSSLTLLVHNILHFLPSIIAAAASIRPAINQSVNQSHPTL